MDRNDQIIAGVFAAMLLAVLLFTGHDSIVAAAWAQALGAFAALAAAFLVPTMQWQRERKARAYELRLRTLRKIERMSDPFALLKNNCEKARTTIAVMRAEQKDGKRPNLMSAKIEVPEKLEQFLDDAIDLDHELAGPYARIVRMTYMQNRLIDGFSTMHLQGSMDVIWNVLDQSIVDILEMYGTAAKQYIEAIYRKP
jgi:hypothetical protein